MTSTGPNNILRPQSFNLLVKRRTVKPQGKEVQEEYVHFQNGLTGEGGDGQFLRPFLKQYKEFSGRKIQNNKFSDSGYKQNWLPFIYFLYRGIALGDIMVQEDERASVITQLDRITRLVKRDLFDNFFSTEVTANDLPELEMQPYDAPYDVRDGFVAQMRQIYKVRFSKDSSGNEQALLTDEDWIRIQRMYLFVRAKFWDEFRNEERNGKKVAYSWHIKHVTGLILYGKDPTLESILLALGHDLIEDISLSEQDYNTLHDICGAKVVAGIRFLSKPKPTDDNFQYTLRYLSGGSKDKRFIKNIRNIYYLLSLGEACWNEGIMLDATTGKQVKEHASGGGPGYVRFSSRNLLEVKLADIVSNLSTLHGEQPDKKRRKIFEVQVFVRPIVVKLKNEFPDYYRSVAHRLSYFQRDLYTSKKEKKHAPYRKSDSSLVQEKCNAAYYKDLKSYVRSLPSNVMREIKEHGYEFCREDASLQTLDRLRTTRLVAKKSAALTKTLSGGVEGGEREDVSDTMQWKGLQEILRKELRRLMYTRKSYAQLSGVVSRLRVSLDNKQLGVLERMLGTTLQWMEKQWNKRWARYLSGVKPKDIKRFEEKYQRYFPMYLPHLLDRMVKFIDDKQKEKQNSSNEHIALSEGIVTEALEETKERFIEVIDVFEFDLDPVEFRGVIFNPSTKVRVLHDIVPEKIARLKNKRLKKMFGHKLVEGTRIYLDDDKEEKLDFDSSALQAKIEEHVYNAVVDVAGLFAAWYNAGTHSLDELSDIRDILRELAQHITILSDEDIAFIESIQTGANARPVLLQVWSKVEDKVKKYIGEKKWSDHLLTCFRGIVQNVDSRSREDSFTMVRNIKQKKNAELNREPAQDIENVNIHAISYQQWMGATEEARTKYRFSHVWTEGIIPYKPNFHLTGLAEGNDALLSSFLGWYKRKYNKTYTTKELGYIIKDASGESIDEYMKRDMQHVYLLVGLREYYLADRSGIDPDACPRYSLMDSLIYDLDKRNTLNEGANFFLGGGLDNRSVRNFDVLKDRFWKRYTHGPINLNYKDYQFVAGGSGEGATKFKDVPALYLPPTQDDASVTCTQVIDYIETGLDDVCNVLLARGTVSNTQHPLYAILEEQGLIAEDGRLVWNKYAWKTIVRLRRFLKYVAYVANVLDKQMQKALEDQKKLEEWFQNDEFKQACGFDEGDVIIAPLKDYGRALEKIVQSKDGDVRAIKDLTRCTFVKDTYTDMHDLSLNLGAYVKDHDAMPEWAAKDMVGCTLSPSSKGTGYRNQRLFVRTKNGNPIEIQGNYRALMARKGDPRNLFLNHICTGIDLSKARENRWFLDAVESDGLQLTGEEFVLLKKYARIAGLPIPGIFQERWSQDKEVDKKLIDPEVENTVRADWFYDIHRIIPESESELEVGCQLELPFPPQNDASVNLKKKLESMEAIIYDRASALTMIAQRKQFSNAA